MRITERVRIHARLISSLVRNPKFWFVLSLDIVLICLAIYLSYLVRFEGSPPPRVTEFHVFLPLLVLIKIPVFYIFGLYRGMWRYTGMSDLINIVKATGISQCVIVLLLLYTTRFDGVSRSVFVLDILFTFLFISGHRIAIRYFYQNSTGTGRLFQQVRGRDKKRLLLIGAGDAAEKVIRETHENTHLPYIVVGIVDDDPHKTGLRIHGVPVVGLAGDLEEHVKRFTPQELLISISAATGEEMKRLVSLCQDTGLPFKVLPGLGELINGKVSIKAIRDISYKDLLGRAEARLDTDRIGGYLTGKTVLVTGAGGTIGSELCRQVVRFRPAQLIILDAGEENLYAIQMELRHELNYTDHVAVLGKVQDARLLEAVFSRHKPAVVFHAAAYKHVPLVENNPWVVVDNNVTATMLLIEAAVLHNVERFVLVSTDKAVRPTNVMGASKRLTELLILAYDHRSWDGTFCSERLCPEPRLPESRPRTHSTIFTAVRFGNVLGSSGSVIPLFKRQIELGGPVTVTHPEITRYFMSIEEAAKLILQAGAMGEGGEIFVLKMGEPIKIAKMARDLIRLAGREPDTEIEIRFTGLREGEKLFEELITEGEGIAATPHEKIMVLHGDARPCAELLPELVTLARASETLDASAIRVALKAIIPEYSPSTVHHDN